MREQDLVQELALFDPTVADHVLAIRRPAGNHLVVEMEVKKGCSEHFQNLAVFWLAGLWRFVEDFMKHPPAFEGLAFQAVAQPLGTSEFAHQFYQQIYQRLTLPPEDYIRLNQAYRFLQGRVTSFAGWSSDGRLWAGFHLGHLYEL